MAIVWLIFDHAVFDWGKRAVFLIMAAEIVGQIFWGYRDSHLGLHAFNFTVTQLAPSTMGAPLSGGQVQQKTGVGWCPVLEKQRGSGQPNRG